MERDTHSLSMLDLLLIDKECVSPFPRFQCASPFPVPVSAFLRLPEGTITS